MKSLSPAAANFLKVRAIPLAAAQAAGLYSVSAHEVAVSIYGPGTSASIMGDAIAIPYKNIEGTEMVGDDGIAYTRFRVLDARTPKDLMAGEKLQRYIARPGSGCRPFIPPGFSELVGMGAFAVITEGEIKSIAATSSGIATMAIPGVTMWAAKPDAALSSITCVHPLILAAIRDAKGVIVLADSDARTNAQVRHAMQSLADAIQAQAGILAVYACCKAPEKEEGKRAIGKQGLDDWIQTEGANAVEKYLSWVWSKAQQKQATLASGGYYPLGYKGDLNYVWSVPRGTMVALSAGQLTQPGTLMNLAGGHAWCKEAYGRMTKTGEIVPEWAVMGGEIVAACIEGGPFDPADCRASGVWDAGDGNALIVNSAESIWRTDGVVQERFGGDCVYPSGRKLGLSPDTEQATTDEVNELLEAIATWHFTRMSDPMLLLGWICHAYLAGAAPWRAHMSLTGARGTGKSFLLQFVGDLLGKAKIACDGDSTPAGIRQHVGADAMALVIDEAEAEAEGRKLAAILTFLRSASSGAEVLRGTQDQAGAKFQLRVAGLVSGVVPPIFSAADQSRFVRLSLDNVNAAAAANPHRVVADRSMAQELGVKLFSRMVHSWGRLKRARLTLRPHLGGDPRYADTIGPVLAAAWVALFDGEMTDAEAAEFVREMDLDSERERVVGTKDEVEAFDHLLGKILTVTIDGKRLEITGAEAIARSLEEVRKTSPNGDYNKSIGRYGLKVLEDGDRGSLLIDTKSPQLKAVYSGTRWEAADLVVVLKRLPGADQKNLSKTVSIGCRSCRPMSLPLPELESGLSKLPATAADLA